MRLYLFQPSKKWAHCGGCVAVLAFSFEQAVETIHANEPDDVGSYVMHFDEADVADGECYDHWVLVDELLADGNDGPRVVLNDWNWA